MSVFEKPLLTKIFVAVSFLILVIVNVAKAYLTFTVRRTPAL